MVHCSGAEERPNICLRSWSSWDWACVLNAVGYFLHIDLGTARLANIQGLIHLHPQLFSNPMREIITCDRRAGGAADFPRCQRWCCTASSAPYSWAHSPACVWRVGVGGCWGLWWVNWLCQLCRSQQRPVSSNAALVQACCEGLPALVRDAPLHTTDNVFGITWFASFWILIALSKLSHSYIVLASYALIIAHSFLPFPKGIKYSFYYFDIYIYMHLFLYIPWKRKWLSQVDLSVLLWFFIFLSKCPDFSRNRKYKNTQKYVHSKEETFPSGDAEINGAFSWYCNVLAPFSSK